VLGTFTDFNDKAANLGARLMARQKNGRGDPIAEDAKMIAQITLSELHRRSSLALMDAALAHDGAGEGQASTNPLLAPLFDNAQSEDKKLVNISMQLGTNLVALGASATTHYPPLSKLLGVEVAVPEHADVAGAVGAAIGSVRQRVMISISQPSEGKFRVHIPDGPVDFGELDRALDRARDTARRLATARAENAGARNIDVTLSDEIKEVYLSANKTLFIEAFIYATAEGRPG